MYIYIYIYVYIYVYLYVYIYVYIYTYITHPVLRGEAPPNSVQCKCRTKLVLRRLPRLVCMGIPKDAALEKRQVKLFDPKAVNT